MNLKGKLKNIVSNVSHVKFELIKKRLISEAENGFTECFVDKGDYDETTIRLLKEEGLNVTEHECGKFTVISWGD